MYKELEDAAIDYPYGKFVANVDDIQSYINNINEANTNYMKQVSTLAPQKRSLLSISRL